VAGGADRYDIIDVSADFVDAAPANVTGVTEEAMRAYLAALRPGGMVSISVSIRDFPVYALRVVSTAREALLATGVADPSAHVMIYRSAWNARILISSTPWSAADIAALKDLLRGALLRRVLGARNECRRRPRDPVQRPAERLVRDRVR
jgi:hypothetical protein